MFINENPNRVPSTTHHNQIFPKIILGGVFAAKSILKICASAKESKSFTTAIVFSTALIIGSLFFAAMPAYAETEAKMQKACIKASSDQKFKGTSTTDVQKAFYFAYGSNLSGEFLKERLKDGEWLPDGWHKTGKLNGPIPRDLGTYTLSDYEFGYSLDLGKETTGNIISKKGSRVYGVLYEISLAQLEKLDRSEDVPVDYQRVAVKVDRVATSAFLTAKAFSLEAWVYVGTPNKYTQRINPDPEYVDLLVNSATRRNFPTEYIQHYLKVPEELQVAIGGEFHEE